MHFGAAHSPPRGPAAEGGEEDGRGGSLTQRVGRRTAGDGSLTQRGEADGRGRKPDGRALPLSGALSGGQQDLYNFPK